MNIYIAFQTTFNIVTPIIVIIGDNIINAVIKELENIKNQNIDITNFQAKMEQFKNDFGRNYRLASERFKKAIDEIEATNPTVDDMLGTRGEE